MQPENGADYREVVEQLADSEKRRQAFRALREAGPAALDAGMEGLAHEDWQVRRWCAIYLDHNADARALRRLVLTLDDPKAKVRRWAVHSIACEPCKEGDNPIDVVPLLAKRIKEDKSIKVRRTAAIMLWQWAGERRVSRIYRRILSDESDEKIRRYARWGLRQTAE